MPLYIGETLIAEISNNGHNHDAGDIVSGKNTAFNKNFGTATDTVCAGDDSRLSDTRAPTAHSHSASNITSGTMATARLGSGSAGSTRFLRGDSTWQVIDTSVGSASISRSSLKTSTQNFSGSGGYKVFALNAYAFFPMFAGATLQGYGTISTGNIGGHTSVGNADQPRVGMAAEYLGSHNTENISVYCYYRYITS